MFSRSLKPVCEKRFLKCAEEKEKKDGKFTPDDLKNGLGQNFLKAK